MSDGIENTSAPKKARKPRPGQEKILPAFGEKNRQRMIAEYFAHRPAATAPWQDVYRLLLWVDSKTGLAHCYESDKSQPGMPWYGRSLAFHDWLSERFAVEPIELAEELDWMFRHATNDLANQVLRKAQRRLQRAASQLRPYKGRSMPTPGEDPVLASMIRDVLGEHISGDVPREKWKELVEKIREYLGLENKRKNILGEGFEDVIGAVVRQASGETIEVRERALLHELPGFNRVREGEKVNKVDVALLPKERGRKTLVTAKWSVRADREKQFAADLADYVSARADSHPFDYVLVTNEFDPARLMRACRHLATNDYMFAYVVHISTEALLTAYGDSKEESVKAVRGYIDSGRLISIDRWLEKIVSS